MLRTIYRITCDGPGERAWCSNKVEGTWSKKDIRREAQALGWTRVRGGLVSLEKNVCPECLARLRNDAERVTEGA